jgi:ketosteroid isomerase-like protein
VTPQILLITKLYTAFARLDYKTMASCYAPEATFRDPVFELSGPDIGAMWHMLCDNASRSKGDFKIDFDGVEADERGGTAHWEARYHYSQTNRPVHNIIDATFRFQGNHIVQHVDDFDFKRWARQALGPVAYVPGLSGMLRRKVQRTALGKLEAFVKTRPEYRLAAGKI